MSQTTLPFRISHRAAWLSALALPVALSGCARSSVSTAVHADGTWTRTVRFNAQAPDKDGSTMGPKLEDVFLLPGGAPWKTKREKQDSEMVYTATRELKPDEAIQRDLALKDSKKPAPKLVNEVTVRTISPGRYEYHEVLHWRGERPKEMEPPAEALRDIKAALPPALATDSNARQIAHAAMVSFWHLLFGPGDPLLPQLMTHADLAERRLRQRFGIELTRIMETKFGDQMTAAQRQALVAKLSSTLTSEAKARKQSSVPGGSGGSNEKGDSASMVALTFAVKLPGKVVATNGEIDPGTGEVFWGMYSEAAAVEDIEMTATCDTNP